MLASAEAQGFVEDLDSVEASIADLITANEAEDMAGAKKTWDFWPSLMTKEMIHELEKEGFVGEGKASPCKVRRSLSPRLPMPLSLGISLLAAFASLPCAFFKRC